MNKIKQYLHALENPTNSGFNSRTRKWGRGEYDPHQFQDGLDDRNTFVKNYLKKHKVDSIPEQDAIMLQDIYLKDLDRIWNNRTKDKNISDFKKTLAYGLMWHGYGPRLWNEGKSKESKRLYEAFQNGSDSEFSDAIYTFYKKYDKDRADRHKIYMNNQPLKENTTKLKFSKPSYIHVEYPDALRVDRLEPYTPIPRTPKPMHPIKENFWKAWSQMPYKQQGGTIMNQTIKKFKQVRKAQQGDKLIKHLSKQLALDAAYGPQYRDWNEVEKTPIKITKEKEVKTAPKAEDRYKNSKAEGTIATNGPFSHIWVTANSSIPFIIPAKIGRVIEGNDTIYYEIPQRSTLVEVKNRAAKRVTPFMNRQNPSYKSFDFKLWDSKFGPMIEKLLPLTNDSLEYETLKRRFNTAWNLSKPK